MLDSRTQVVVLNIILILCDCACVCNIYLSVPLLAILEYILVIQTVDVAFVICYIDWLPHLKRMNTVLLTEERMWNIF